MRAACLFSVFAVTISLAAQTKAPGTPPARTTPQPPSVLRAQQVRATVEGCLSGTRLVRSLTTNHSLDEAVLNASEFSLDGPRELMRQLRSGHDGHLERITGIATIPQPEGTTVETHGATKGKTRVTSGVRVSQAGQSGTAISGEAQLPVRLRVQSVEHLADTCAPQR